MKKVGFPAPFPQKLWVKMGFVSISTKCVWINSSRCAVGFLLYSSVTDLQKKSRINSRLRSNKSCVETIRKPTTHYKNGNLFHKAAVKESIFIANQSF